jgi:hypothetical protein
MNMTSWDIIFSRSNCKDVVSATTAHLCHDDISAKEASCKRGNLRKDPIFAKTAHLRKDPIVANVDLHSIGMMMGLLAVIPGISNLSLFLSHEYHQADSDQLTNGKDGRKQHF